MLLSRALHFAAVRYWELSVAVLVVLNARVINPNYDPQSAPV